VAMAASIPESGARSPRPWADGSRSRPCGASWPRPGLLIDQQDAANEELRSANKEMLSINEELQSTNEELETAKEELLFSGSEMRRRSDHAHPRRLTA